tara:strand:- start:170 stop:442 length:273 start_codon:yes stop_codon:yes gene_type:complete
MVKWGLNNNECLITQLENKFKEDEIKMLKKDDDNDDKETDDKGTEKQIDVSFTKDLCNKMGIEISEYGLNVISYLTFYHSFLQSYWRVIF